MKTPRNPSRRYNFSRNRITQFRFSKPLHCTFVGTLAGLFVMALFSLATVQAAGDQQPSCKSGWVYSSSLKKCIKKTSEILTDDDLYASAYALVEEKEYELARDLLYRIKDQHQPRVLNYIGYTTRKLGRIDDGIRYYKLALKLDPDYVQARQYLGEGYLQKGAVGLAKKELMEIAQRCGLDCNHYLTLAAQITKFEQKSSS